MPAPEALAVEVSGLVVRYGPVVAVDGVDLRACHGEVVAVLGRNGAGKTSTIEAVEGYRPAAAGTVRVLGLDPQRSDGQRALTRRVGVMLQQGGNVDVALAMAQTARRGMPNSANAADTLGWAYYKKGAYASAIDLFQEALQKSPNDPSFHYHLGLAYQQAGKLPLAKEHLQKVLKIDPNFPDADDVRRTLSELHG